MLTNWIRYSAKRHSMMPLKPGEFFATGKLGLYLIRSEGEGRYSLDLRDQAGRGKPMIQIERRQTLARIKASAEVYDAGPDPFL